MAQLREKTIGAFVLGLALAVGPGFVGNPAIRNGLGSVRVLGWVCMFGALMLIGCQLFIRRLANARSATRLEGRGPSRERVPVQPVVAAASQVPRTDTAAAKTFAAGRVTAPRETLPTPARPLAWSPQVFDMIEWRRFESLCERLFAQAGFETQALSHGADEGIDIWLYSRTQPDLAVSLVQCKCWGSRQVGVVEVRALLGSMAAKKVKRGVFATTSRFSADAARFCKDNGIHTLDRAGLLDLIGKRTPAQQQELLTVATEGEFWVPTCASCGVKMIRRTPKKGGRGFWGCVKFPSCRNVING